MNPQEFLQLKNHITRIIELLEKNLLLFPEPFRRRIGYFVNRNNIFRESNFSVENTADMLLALFELDYYFSEVSYNLSDDLKQKILQKINHAREYYKGNILLLDDYWEIYEKATRLYFAKLKFGQLDTESSTLNNNIVTSTVQVFRDYLNYLEEQLRRLIKKYIEEKRANGLG